MLAVGFVGGMIASHGTSGFLGALAAGFIAGYIIALVTSCPPKEVLSGESTSHYYI